MPKKNVVARISNIENDGNELRLSFDNRAGRIDISQKTRTLLPQILKASQDDDAPLWFDLDDETGLIEEIDIPFPSAVTGLTPVENGYTVFLELQQDDPCFLSDDIDDFSSILAVLEFSLQNNDQRIWVATKMGTRDIVGALKEPAITRQVIEPLNYYHDEQHFYPIDPTNVQEYFQFLSDLATPIEDPIGNPGIPYLFLRTGCHARAHEMCRRLVKRYSHIHPFKIWIYAKNPSVKQLHMETENHPKCKVEWTYHVVPALLTPIGMQVLDPSVADRPLSIAELKRQLNSPDANIYFTSARIYAFRESQKSFKGDPHHEETRLFIGAMNRSLALMVEKNFAPPYAHCTVQT